MGEAELILKVQNMFSYLFLEQQSINQWHEIKMKTHKRVKNSALTVKDMNISPSDALLLLSRPLRKLKKELGPKTLNIFCTRACGVREENKVCTVNILCIKFLFLLDSNRCI